MEFRKICHMERPGGPEYAIVMTRYSHIKYILRNGPVIIDRPHTPAGILTSDMPACILICWHAASILASTLVFGDYLVTLETLASWYMPVCACTYSHAPSRNRMLDLFQFPIPILAPQISQKTMS